MCKCGIYLTSEFRILPSHMALVFPAFKHRPDLFQKSSMVLMVSSTELSPSSIISLYQNLCLEKLDFFPSRLNSLINTLSDFGVDIIQGMLIFSLTYWCSSFYRHVVRYYMCIIIISLISALISIYPYQLKAPQSWKLGSLLPVGATQCANHYPTMYIYCTEVH